MTMTGMLLSITAALDEHGHETGHVHSGDFMTDFMNLATDPAHLAFEFVFSIVFDFIIVTLLYGVVIQKIIIPRLRKSIHEEIDREHGVSHPVESKTEAEPKNTDSIEEKKDDNSNT